VEQMINYFRQCEQLQKPLQVEILIQEASPAKMFWSCIIHQGGNRFSYLTQVCSCLVTDKTAPLRHLRLILVLRLGHFVAKRTRKSTEKKRGTIGTDGH
jgi:hypothetical protein